MDMSIPLVLDACAVGIRRRDNMDKNEMGRRGRKRNGIVIVYNVQDSRSTEPW